MSHTPSSHTDSAQPDPTYQRIYTVVRLIPRGQVATIVGDCTARMVGYAMAAVTPQDKVPWHRVINAQGKISLRADGGGAAEQRARLEAEGIVFDAQERVPLNRVRWPGPSMEWLQDNGFDPLPLWRAE